MDKSYQDWIDLHYPTSLSARLKCKVIAHRMATLFPELKVVRGQVSVEEPYGLPSTKTQHWWCVTPEGKVVDPTAHQYPTSVLAYRPLDESKGEPTGKCMNCGGICYEHRTLCSKACEIAFSGSIA